MEFFDFSLSFLDEESICGEYIINIDDEDYYFGQKNEDCFNQLQKHRFYLTRMLANSNSLLQYVYSFRIPAA
jgi:hypothetical protein